MGDLIRTREEWLARRRLGIGGSDAPVVVLGRVYDSTAENLRMEKAGHLPGDEEPNDDMRRGSALEDDALAEFVAVTGRAVRSPGGDLERWNDFWFTHPSYPWAYANLDAVLPVPGPPMDAEIVEVKCPRSSRWYEIRDAGLPDYWQIQAQHQMWVTGAKVVHFWIFNADAWRGLHIALPRDEQLIARIEEAEELFWRHVELDVPLPARAPTEALVPVGRTALDVSSNEDWRSLFEVLREANERVEAAKAEQDKLKALVSDLLADLGVDGVRCDGARASIVRKAGSERLDRKALVAAHPNVDLRAFLSVGAPSEYVTIETKSRARSARSKGASR